MAVVLRMLCSDTSESLDLRPLHDPGTDFGFRANKGFFLKKHMDTHDDRLRQLWTIVRYRSATLLSGPRSREVNVEIIDHLVENVKLDLHNIQTTVATRYSIISIPIHRQLVDEQLQDSLVGL